MRRYWAEGSRAGSGFLLAGGGDFAQKTRATGAIAGAGDVFGSEWEGN